MFGAECSRVGTERCNHATNYTAGNLKITQKNPSIFLHNLKSMLIRQNQTPQRLEKNAMYTLSFKSVIQKKTFKIHSD